MKQMLIPENVLSLLPVKFYVINFRDREIIDTNDPEFSELLNPCHKYLFNKDSECLLREGKCICQQLSDKGELSDYIIEKGEGIEKEFFKVSASLLNEDENTAVVHYNNITESIRLKKELKINTKRLERAEKLVDFGYWEFNIHDKIVNASKGAADIYGVNSTKLTLEYIQGIPLKKYRNELNIHLKELIIHNKPYNINYQIKRPNDGEIRTIHSIAEFREDKQMVFGVIHDVTESTRANRALVESENKFKLLFENMNNGFAYHKIVTDEKGKPVDYIFLDVNKKFEMQTGLKKENIVGKRVKEILPKIEDFWIERYGEVALTGKPTTFTDFSQDLDKHFEISAYSPKKNYFAVTFSDVTAKVKSEQAFLQSMSEIKLAKEKAEESDRLKSIFLANMSHEIRTPLNIILGFSNIICSGNLAQDKLDYFGSIIDSSGKRLIKVIDDIIEISMLQTDQVKFDFAEFEVDEVLLDLFDIFKTRYSLRLKDIDLKIKLFDNAEQARIVSDKNKLKHILEHLVDNAFKYTQKGIIEFGCSEITDSFLILSVKDTGIGIEKSKTGIIFEPFRQAEEGDSRKYEGSGLGLAIVEDLLGKLGGEIYVDSEVNKGSTFYIKLPKK